MPFPLLFTISTTTRHELILLSSADTPLPTLQSRIQSTIPSSKNCEEFMAKYKKKGEDGNEVGEKVASLKVRWSSAGRDMQSWPAVTVVTEGNCGAVLAMVERGGGRDVLEVEIGEGEGEGAAA